MNSQVSVNVLDNGAKFGVVGCRRAAAAVLVCHSARELYAEVVGRRVMPQARFFAAENIHAIVCCVLSASTAMECSDIL